MSEATPGVTTFENLGGKLEGRQKASGTRKPNFVPLIIKVKPLVQPPNLRDMVWGYLADDMQLLRNNLKWIIWKRGANVSHFCREMHKVGIMVSRKGITQGGDRFSVQLQYITTMALALRVPTWVMIHPDIASVWDSLNLD